jgi:hypothetical protein
VFANGGVELAARGAQLPRISRAQTDGAETLDRLIATFCLVHQHSLLHRES